MSQQTIEQNKQLVRDFYTAAFIKHDFEKAAQFLSPDYVLHDPSVKSGDCSGVENWKKLQSNYFKSMPDHRLEIQDVIAEGDKVVIRWFARGTQTGALGKIAPSGNPIATGGISIARVLNGKISEEWQEWDTAGYYRQIKLQPDLRIAA